jgi:hypothetical protein
MNAKNVFDVLFYAVVVIVFVSLFTNTGAQAVSWLMEHQIGGLVVGILALVVIFILLSIRHRVL